MENSKADKEIHLKAQNIAEGLVHRILEEAAQGNTDATIASIANQIRERAVTELKESDDKNKYLAACDLIINFINSNPNKSVLDMFRENKKKK